MNVHITEPAQARIDALKGNRDGQMHLFYETEGCGCGNSGIFEIRYVTETTPEDVEIDSNVGPNPDQELDENLFGREHDHRLS